MSAATAGPPAIEVGHAHAFLKVLRSPGEVLEVRGLRGHRKPTDSGYFDFESIALAARCAAGIDAPGIYVTLNPVRSELLSRAFNRIEKRADHATGDEHITCRKWLFIDIDAERLPGISSTDTEHDKALKRADEVRDWLINDHGWNRPLLIDSGNGAYLLFPVDLPNDPEALRLTERVLKAVSNRWSGDGVKIDSTVANASRITRLPGTINRKGDSSPERPHRLCRGLSLPEYLKGGWSDPIPREKLEAVASLTFEDIDSAGANRQRNTTPIDYGDSREAALNALSKLQAHRSDDRDLWLKVGMALHSVDSSDAMLAEWDEWSSKNSKHKEGECAAKWKGFKAGGGIGIGTIIEWAKEDCPGWKPTRKHQPITTAARQAPLSPGTKVLAGDRGNVGTIVEDHGDSATVHFVSPDGNEATKDLPKSQLKHLDGRSLDSTAPPFSLELIDSPTFASTKYDQRFLIKGIMVERQPCMVGGAQKSMKTSIAVDLAISLGTGTPFLGQFSVPRQIRVGVISGESGAFTLQETGKRIAEARLRPLADANVYWGFRLPQLGLDDHLKALADAVAKNEIKALIIDPAYLCMLNDREGRPINFANLFEIGSVLIRVSEHFAAMDCTPIILHHESKGAANQRRASGNVPMELQDLSMSGFAEWARQWLLISRREPYEHGTGDHRLWMNVGGSAGHGGLYAVDISEGIQNDDFTGRQWEVKVSTSTGVKEQAAQKKKKATDEKRERVLDVLQKNLNNSTR